MPDQLLNTDLKTGDVVRFSEESDVETWVVDTEGRLYRDDAADDFIFIPVAISMIFPNAIDHYRTLFESEESELVAIELKSTDEWLTQRFGSPLPDSFQDVTIATTWIEGELHALEFNGIDCIDDGLTLSSIAKTMESLKQPQSSFLLWFNINEGLDSWTNTQQEREKDIGSLVRKYNWFKDRNLPLQGYYGGGHSSSSSMSISFWGPTESCELVIEEIKKFFNKTKAKIGIEGPRENVKISVQKTQNRGGKGFTLEHYWVPTEFKYTPL